MSTTTTLPSLTALAKLPFTLLLFFVVELPKSIFLAVFNALYVFGQSFVILAFKPSPPSSKEQVKYRGRIAVVGAGLTGVSSAAHAAAHGFDVVIYEKGDHVGGIWASVNKTSGLQLNSLLYRFHPAVRWNELFPHRDEILGEIKRVQAEYNLGPRTRYNTPVTSVKRAENTDPPSDEQTDGGSKWIINDGRDGEFDAVIVTVGTCGDPNMVTMKGMPGWKEEQERKEQQKEESKKANGSKMDHSKGSHIDRPTQDDSEHGRGFDLGVWEATKPKENAWDVGRDQTIKSEQGFPKLGEVYSTTDDVQMPVEEVLGEGLHAMVRVTGGGGTGTHKHSEKRPHPHSHKKEESDDNEGDVYRGPILHSSGLDREGAPSFEGKTIVVIGSGASAVEAVETALAKGARKCVVIARQDKWIIPRNIVIDTLISAQPFGREMPLSFLWEKFITWFNYHGVQDLVPSDLGLFEGTPVVNDEFLGHVRNGRCDYVRGDIDRLIQSGVRVNVRQRNTKPGDKGDTKDFDADVVVMATGFHKPDISFLPEDLFPEGYERPNLYLQNFSTEDWSVLMTNSAYTSAIGTVGHFHIGIYARILMTFLMDKNARPTPKDMKLWVDVVRFIKRGARGGALGFFTYMELTIWLLLFHLLRLDRLKWLFFIMQGWGVRPNYAAQNRVSA